MVSELTIGVLGYGRIGSRVARMAAALGSRVVATKRHGPFEPAAPLAWLSADNDRLYREADVVVVTASGTSNPGLINATALKLMKDTALLVPVSAGPIAFPDLEAALISRPSLYAVLDTWPSGCWHYPNASCAARGARAWPASARLAALPNVLPLPAMSMRDAVFWESSVRFVAQNLERLAAGQPLQHVVRNATAAVFV